MNPTDLTTAEIGILSQMANEFDKLNDAIERLHEDRQRGGWPLVSHLKHSFDGGVILKSSAALQTLLDLSGHFSPEFAAAADTLASEGPKRGYRKVGRDKGWWF